MNAMRFLLAALLLALGHGVGAGGVPPAPPEPSAASEEAGEEPAWLGLFLRDAPDGGVRVVAVADGGPAARAGVREGDLLLAVNDRPVMDRRSLREVVRDLKPGEKVALETLRDGKTMTRAVLAAPPVIRLRIPVFGDTGVPDLPGGEAFFLPDGGLPAAAGLTTESIPPELRRHLGAPPDMGVLVTHVVPGGRASSAGIKVGDVILRAGGAPLREARDLDLRLVRHGEKAPLPLQILRDGKPLGLSLEAPPETRPGAGREKRLAEIEAEMAVLKARMQALQREIDRIGDGR